MKGQYFINIYEVSKRTVMGPMDMKMYWYENSYQEGRALWNTFKCSVRRLAQP